MKRKLQTGHGNETLQMIPPDIFICDHVACTSITVPLKQMFVLVRVAI